MRTKFRKNIYFINDPTEKVKPKFYLFKLPLIAIWLILLFFLPPITKTSAYPITSFDIITVGVLMVGISWVLQGLRGLRASIIHKMRSIK